MRCSRPTCQSRPEDGSIKHLENKTHREFALYKVNPELCIFQLARLIVGVAKRCPGRIDVIEFNDPLPYRRGECMKAPISPTNLRYNSSV
jgi:hypothetical protein